MSDSDLIATYMIKQDSGEAYMLIYHAHRWADVCRALGRWARDEELSFNWMDAETMEDSVRDIERRNCDGR